jgi:multiple sugar transport system substrate-binding protein
MRKIIALSLALMLLLAGTTSALAEKTKIEMWTLFTGDDGSTMQSIVDSFNASQDQVELTHVAIDLANLYTKLALSVNTDSCPDLFVTYTYDIPYFVSKGMIQPMDSALSSYADFDFSLDKYHQSATVANMLNGKRYAVSLDFPTWGMYINTDLAKKYCPEVLESKVLTFDEIKTIGEKLKSEGSDIKVLASGWARNDLINTYLELADSWASKDGQSLDINRDAAIKTIDLWKECYDAGYLWQEGDDPASLFALGECIFYTGGTWNMTAVKQYGFDFSFIPAPQVSADKVAVFGASHAFMMPTRTYTDKETQAIDSFMSYFYKNSLMWAQAGSIVASNDARATDEYQAMPQADISNNYSIADAAYTYTSVVLDVLNSFDWQPVYGQMTSAEFADSWIKQAQEKIAAQ